MSTRCTEEPVDGPDPADLDDVVVSLRGLQQVLDTEGGVDAAMCTLSAQVKRLLPGADMASVTLVDVQGPRTVGQTDERVVEIDAAQYRTNQGPCLLAAVTNEPVRAGAALAHELWPDFVSAPELVGVASFLSAPLDVDGTYAGALNVFGFDDHGFGKVDEAMLELYTTVAAGAIRSARRYMEAAEVIGQLQRALESRAVIDQAKGVIMAARGIDAEAAFAVLVEQSQRQNVKVREIAERVVAGLGYVPAT